MTLESVVRTLLDEIPTFREDYPYTAKLLYEALGEEPPEYVSTRYLPKETERFEFINGWARVHNATACEPDYACVIHRHSEHPGSELPMLLRETGLVEHYCSHGVGHPCPDSAAYFNRAHAHKLGTWETHGCLLTCVDEGCCG